MLILGTDEAGVQQAARILRGGGLAAFPTETVYGLGADAFNEAALARVFEVKGRPRFDPLIVHIAAAAALERPALLSALPSARRALLDKLAAAFWPGPLTLVLPKRPELPGLVTAGLSTVAVRVPDHPAARALIERAGSGGLPGTVAAPSANPFGRLSPTRVEHVIEGLGGKIDCVIDGGPCTVGVESTVLDLSAPEPAILRPGGVSREALEAVCRMAFSPRENSGAMCEEHCAAPGMLKSHYAPASPLFLHTEKEMAALPYKNGEGYMFFSGRSRDAWAANTGGNAKDGAPVAVLSESGDILEAASRLFACLHALDARRPSRVHAELLPARGLGEAVNDRLNRGAIRGADSRSDNAVLRRIFRFSGA
jgi:L-threonylcarbamoyladenylate synthase